MGKSRIIATASLIAAMNGITVNIVFPNSVLLQRDREDFKDYWQLSSSEEKVKYHQDLNFSVEKDELVIIDESDVFIYNHTDQFSAIL